MNFESLVTAFAGRFLSDRSMELIVAPALADLQFDPGAGPLKRAVNQLAVLRAVAGGVRHEVAGGLGFFVVLTLMSAGYNVALFTVFADFIADSTDLFGVSLALLVVSLAPVVACFWPTRHSSSRQLRTSAPEHLSTSAPVLGIRP